MYETYQVAVANDPKKKGVKLYEVEDDGSGSWVWARSAEQAIAAVAKSRGGYVARIHRIGASFSTEVGDGNPSADK